MRIQGIYQFYLDYVLPRSTEGEPVCVTMVADEFVSQVSTRSFDSPLFPNEIDETMSSMTASLTRMDRSSESATRIVRDLCLDRIQVVLEWGTDLSPENVEDEVDRSLQRAVEVTDYFLEHYRFVAMSPFVRKIERVWRPQDGRFYIIAPHTITWFNLDDNGSHLRVFQYNTNGRASSGSIRSPESGFASNASVLQSLATDDLPPFHLSLLIDAEEAIQNLRTREGVLSMATSTEIAARRYVEARGASDQRVRTVLDEKGISFSARYYDRMPMALNGRSLAQEFGKQFALIEQMYQQRNSLIHEGIFKPDVRHLKRGELQKLAYSWLDASRAAVNWLGYL